MRRFFEKSHDKKSTDPSTKGTPAISVAVAPNAALAVAMPTSIAVISRTQHPSLPETSSVDSFDATLDIAITTCNTVKEIGEMIPEPAAGPIKGTFGVLILVLETIKRCKDNREGWKSLAEMIIEKNKHVESLLQLYAKASEDHPNALEQAMNYQRVLNTINMDIKKETEKPEETTQGLEFYWSRIKTMRREAALSNINAARIASYQDELRTITLDVVEETVVRGAMVAAETNRMVKKLVEQVKPTEPTIFIKPRPRVVEDFIGREDILSGMHCTHFEDQTTRRDRPIITVLTAMGGSGKTQIAVKFASQFEEKLPEAPVYFLNASSDVSLEADLKTLLKSRTASYEDALAWLATEVPNWLLIMDNADDPSLDLSKYIPRSSHGHIIITTRNETHRTIAPRSTHIVDALPLEESITLLLRSSGSEDNDTNRLLAKDIVEEVGRLPLAISHAAAYICVHGRLGAYLGMYRKSQLQFLQKQPTQAYNYPRSVAGTIQLSYDCLSLDAQQLLQLFSYFNIQSIPRCIIERAAERGFSRVFQKTVLPLPPNDITAEYANVLRGMFCLEGEWSDSRFDDMVEGCLKYSLLQSTVVGEVYSMHPLVQAYLHSTSLLIHNHPPQKLATRLLASSITPGINHLIFDRILLPHIRLIALEDVTEAGDYYGFGYVLMEFGDKLSITHLQQSVSKWKQLSGDEHEDTLAAMILLTCAYCALGREKDSLPLEEEILEKRRKVLGPDHLDTLKAINNLALTYQSLGRYNDALPLQEEVLEKRKKLLGPDHLDTLRATSNLALGYQSLDRYKEALPLQEEVLEKHRKLLGSDHLDTLTAMNNLALTYQSLGRASEALPLMEEVLEKRKKLLGSDHRNTVSVMHYLLLTYDSLSMENELKELGRTALPLLESVYGESHEWTVWAKKRMEQFHK